MHTHSPKKWKIYDFDGTIIEGHSIFHLLRYAKDRKILSRGTILKHLLVSVLRYVTQGLRGMKGELSLLVDRLTEDEKRDFAKYVLHTYGYPRVLRTIHEDDATLILCTASFESYMCYVAEELDIPYLIGTKHKDGKVLGDNNAKDEKKHRLAQLFMKIGEIPEMDDVRCYTDSVKNDGPMCSFAETKYVVNDTASGYITIHAKTGEDEKTASS